MLCGWNDETYKKIAARQFLFPAAEKIQEIELLWTTIGNGSYHAFHCSYKHNVRYTNKSTVCCSATPVHCFSSTLIEYRVTPQTWFIYLLISMAQPIYFRVTWKPESLTILFLAKMYFFAGSDLSLLVSLPFRLTPFLIYSFPNRFLSKSAYFPPFIANITECLSIYCILDCIFSHIHISWEADWVISHLFYFYFIFFLKQHARYWILF